MRHICRKCERSYSDIACSTICPHKGIGFCIVCDCVICVCTEDTAGDWERSANNREGK